MSTVNDAQAYPSEEWRREIRAAALEDMADAWPFLTNDPGNRKTVQRVLRDTAAAIRAGV